MHCPAISNKTVPDAGLFCEEIVFALRGPELHRRFKVLLHLFFQKGMDYTIILKNPKDASIIVSERLPRMNARFRC